MLLVKYICLLSLEVVLKKFDHVALKGINLKIKYHKGQYAIDVSHRLQIFFKKLAVWDYRCSDIEFAESR